MGGGEGRLARFEAATLVSSNRRKLSHQQRDSHKGAARLTGEVGHGIVLGFWGVAEISKCGENPATRLRRSGRANAGAGIRDDRKSGGAVYRNVADRLRRGAEPDQ